jgi:tRNA-2-methylthio-N6-dimethylallyladenosine synthase
MDEEDVFAGSKLPDVSGGRPGVSAFVTIMQGCDNFCAYCVVPYVRGREKSRPPDDILGEVARLAERGLREVTLLGQNVNSYGKREGFPSFAGLLRMVDSISGVERIRFVTSHPKDLSAGLIDAFGGLSRLCPNIHLPVQSGSDRVLSLMNRGYTSASYLEKVAALKSVRPGMGLSSDIIVGFPGETESDFNDTLSLVKEADFDSVFAFGYSDRPPAPSCRFDGRVGEEEKSRRLSIILALSGDMTRKKNEARAGRIETVLVEGRSKKSKDQWTGRTPENRIVNFSAPLSWAGENTGRLVSVRIFEGLSHSLRGRLVEKEARKTEESHAA